MTNNQMFTWLKSVGEMVSQRDSRKTLIDKITKKFQQPKRDTWPPVISENHNKQLKKEFLFQTSNDMIAPCVCASCHQICMKRDMKNQSFCTDCQTSFDHQKLPKFHISNQLELCQIPDCLKGLTYPEKVCISL
jgi:hypothetical protein